MTSLLTTLPYLAALTWGAVLVVRNRRRHGRRQQAIAHRLKRLARGEAVIEPPRACCPYWTASRGMVHSHDCVTLPSLEAAYEDLLAACCERWWTSLETDHDPTCHNQTRRSAA